MGKLIFEELRRIQEIMFFDNTNKNIISEQVWKLVADYVDTFLGTSKFTDDAVKNAADVLKKSGSNVKKIQNLAKFIDVIEKSSSDAATFDKLLDEVVNNLDTTSKKNLDTLDKRMATSIENQGDVTNELIQEYKKELNNILDVGDPLLTPLKNKIIEKQTKKWYGSASDLVSKEQKLRAPGGLKSGQNIVASVNKALQNEVPPKKVTLVQLRKVSDDTDKIIKQYEKGEISLDQLRGFINTYAVDTKEFVDKFGNGMEIYGSVWEAIRAFFKEPGKATADLAKYVRANGKNFLWATIWTTLLGGAIYGAYEVGSYFGLVGPGKAEQALSKEDIACIKTIGGYRSLDTDQLEELFKIKLDNGQRIGCVNTYNDADQSIKITYITALEPTAGDPRVGFKFDFADNTSKTYYSSGGSAAPAPKTTCVWETEDEAKIALRGSFPSAEDGDITVDLTGCTVSYKNPILKATATYTPDDL